MSCCKMQHQASPRRASCLPIVSTVIVHGFCAASKFQRPRLSVTEAGRLQTTSLETVWSLLVAEVTGNRDHSSRREALNATLPGSLVGVKKDHSRAPGRVDSIGCADTFLSSVYRRAHATASWCCAAPISCCALSPEGTRRRETA